MHEQTSCGGTNSPASEPYAGLTKAEELSLKQADEKLRLARQEHAKLEYLRQKRSSYHLKMRHARRKKRRAAERIDVSERTKECRSNLRTSREIQNSFPPEMKRNADIQISGEEIVSLYRELASLGALAKHLSLTRKTAVYKLRIAGVDVIEEIAVAW